MIVGYLKSKVPFLSQNTTDIYVPFTDNGWQILSSHKNDKYKSFINILHNKRVKFLFYIEKVKLNNTVRYRKKMINSLLEYEKYNNIASRLKQIKDVKTFKSSNILFGKRHKQRAKKK